MTNTLCRNLFLIANILIFAASGKVAANEVGKPADGDARGSKKLEGTWRVEITVRNCQTGEALRSPFPALATFSRGGMMITSDGSFSPSLRSAGHGVWQHNTGHQYEAVSEAFLFNPAGILTGRQRLTQVIELEEDTFTATVSASILDLSGNVIGSGCATSAAQRVE